MSKPDIADNFQSKKMYMPEEQSVELSSQVSDMMIKKCPSSVGNININVNVGANEIIKDFGGQKQLDFGAAQLYPSKDGAEYSATKNQNHDGGLKELPEKFASGYGGKKENFSPPIDKQFQPDSGFKGMKELKGMKGPQLDDLIILAADKNAGQLKWENKKI